MAYAVVLSELLQKHLFQLENATVFGRAFVNSCKIRKQKTLKISKAVIARKRAEARTDKAHTFSTNAVVDHSVCLCS